MPDVLKDAKDAQKDHRWINRLAVAAHSVSKRQREQGNQKREVVANLFAGDWTKLVETDGDETHILFRGGNGYVPSDSLGEERLLEIYFIDVGQGDSILIQTADDRRILIDGGKDTRAFSFIKWKYDLEKYFKDFDAIIMTHADDDHAGGLLPILNNERVLVRRIYHNGIARRQEEPALGKEEKLDGKRVLTELYSDVDELKPKESELSAKFKAWVDAVSAAKARAQANNIDFQCIRADQNTPPLVFGGERPLKISFVNPINLGTKSAPKLATFGKDSETINGNSVAVLVEYGKARILLCGDMNEQAEKLFLQHCNMETPIAHVFKASHHGSQYFSTDFLRIVQPWISIVSSGDDPDYGHPRASLLGSLGRYAPSVIEKPLLFSTEVAGTFKEVTVKSPDTGSHLYEKTVHGLINIRTNGEWLAAGRVYNIRRKKERARYAKSLWDWEKYAFSLRNAKPLSNDLSEDA